MNLKKSTFVLCLLISGSSLPTGCAQLQLLPRHKRTCLGLLMTFLSAYILKAGLTSITPCNAICYNVTATATSITNFSQRTVSLRHPINNCNLTPITSPREHLTDALTAAVNADILEAAANLRSPGKCEWLYINKVNLDPTPCTDKTLILIKPEDIQLTRLTPPR